MIFGCKLIVVDGDRGVRERTQRVAQASTTTFFSNTRKHLLSHRPDQLGAPLLNQVCQFLPKGLFLGA